MEIYINLLSAVGVSALLSWLFLPMVRYLCFRIKLFDPSDERKVHTGIIPRLGGVVFLPALSFTFHLIISVNILLQTPFASSFNTVLSAELMLGLSGLALLYFIGIGDDLINVGYRYKLVIQLIAGLLIASSGIWINDLHGLFEIHEISAAAGIPLTIILIVFIINSINFIDGVDGLASGIGMFAFLCYGFIFLRMQLFTYSILAFCSLGVLIPFFFYNVFGKTEKGKKIFMGDTGSLTIGLLLSLFAIKVCNYDPKALYQLPQAFVFAFSVLIVPMFDALRVIFLRVTTGKSPFSPDNNHLHHHFLQLNYSHKSTTMTILMIAVLFAGGSIMVAPHVRIEILVGLVALLWIAMEFYLKMRIKQRVRITISYKRNQAI